MVQNPSVWLIPSFHGDIKLESLKPNVTTLHAYELTAWEEKAMETLRSKALSRGLFKSPWCTEESFKPLTNSLYRTRDGITIELATSIGNVEKVLSKALRPERQLVKAMRFSDGKVSEIEGYRTPAPGSTELATEKEIVHQAEVVEEKKSLAEKIKEVAVTVAEPVLGCPMPDFPQADIRASRVLETFLNEDQIRDYRKEGCFVSTGADTGHRYLICNREQPAVMRARLVGRQLFDLDLNRPICVHDWAVPPPEEMLSLHLCISLPGRESKLLLLPEIDPALAFDR